MTERLWTSLLHISIMTQFHRISGLYYISPYILLFCSGQWYPSPENIRMSQPAFITQERKPAASKKEIEFVDKLKHLFFKLLRRKTFIKSKTNKIFILCTWISFITNFSLFYPTQLLRLQLLSFLQMHFPKAPVSGILNLVVWFSNLRICLFKHGLI